MANNNESKNLNGRGFKTDTDITGIGLTRKKPLQAWTGGDEIVTNNSLEQDLSNGRSWDQFKANERLTGGKTDYHEDIYTTKLDRTGSDYRAREQRAAQLEREILKVGVFFPTERDRH